MSTRLKDDRIARYDAVTVKPLVADDGLALVCASDPSFAR